MNETDTEKKLTGQTRIFVDPERLHGSHKELLRGEDITPDNSIWQSLSWRLALLIFSIVVISSVIAFSLTGFITSTTSVGISNALAFSRAFRNILMPILTILLATLLTVFSVRKFTGPISKITEATRRITDGDYSTRVPEMHRRDEIGELQRNFNTMVRELESSELIRKDFTANISHEFKTPLAIIQGYSRLLEEPDISNEDRIKYAGLITRESERLVHLSSNLLRLSRLENQCIVASPVPFMLDEQILQTIVLLEPKWSKKNIDFNVDIDEAWFTGDEELLSQVWVNLIDNAVKFSQEDTEIAITLRRISNMLEIMITDHGVGIDSETERNAFRKYYRGNTSAKSEGSGLGLSIVKRIVDLHKGTVCISGTPGEGTCVTVMLPDNTPTKARDAERIQKR